VAGVVARRQPHRLPGVLVVLRLLRRRGCHPVPAGAGKLLCLCVVVVQRRDGRLREDVGGDEGGKGESRPGRAFYSRPAPRCRVGLRQSQASARDSIEPNGAETDRYATGRFWTCGYRALRTITNYRLCVCV
jgi:hypothetical protein